MTLTLILLACTPGSNEDHVGTSRDALANCSRLDDGPAGTEAIDYDANGYVSRREASAVGVEFFHETTLDDLGRPISTATFSDATERLEEYEYVGDTWKIAAVIDDGETIPYSWSSDQVEIDRGDGCLSTGKLGRGIRVSSWEFVCDGELLGEVQLSWSRGRLVKESSIWYVDGVAMDPHVQRRSFDGSGRQTKVTVADDLLASQTVTTTWDCP